MNPKDNPHIYGTRAAERQRFHDQWQAKRDAQYQYKPNPPSRVPQPPNTAPIFTPRASSSPHAVPTAHPGRRRSMSPKSASTIVGLIVGFIAVVYAAAHGVTSTLGLACAFGFTAGPVVAVLKKLTKS